MRPPDGALVARCKSLSAEGSSDSEGALVARCKSLSAEGSSHSEGALVTGEKPLSAEGSRHSEGVLVTGEIKTKQNPDIIFGFCFWRSGDRAIGLVGSIENRLKTDFDDGKN